MEDARRARPSAARTRAETLERAVELADYEALRAEQERAREEGRLSGSASPSRSQPARAPGLVAGDRLRHRGRAGARSARAGRPRHRLHLPDADGPEPRDDARAGRRRRARHPVRARPRRARRHAARRRSLFGTGASRASNMAATRWSPRARAPAAPARPRVGCERLGDGRHAARRGARRLRARGADLTRAPARPSTRSPTDAPDADEGGWAGTRRTSARRGRPRDAASSRSSATSSSRTAGGDQPRGRRGPDPRRHRAGHRGRAARAGRLRRGGPVPLRQLHELPAADGRWRCPTIEIEHLEIPPTTPTSPPAASARAGR